MDMDATTPTLFVFS